MNSIFSKEITMNILVSQKDYYLRVLKNMIHYYTFIKKLLLHNNMPLSEIIEVI
jgi:hypothetical protein